MKDLLYTSNFRARVAITAIRVAGRTPELMAELRDGLFQRLYMRESAKFELWYLANETRLKREWETFVARHPFRCSSGSEQRDFDNFVSQQYNLSNP